jgi:hypothetical protein
MRLRCGYGVDLIDTLNTTARHESEDLSPLDWHFPDRRWFAG